MQHVIFLTGNYTRNKEVAFTLQAWLSIRADVGGGKRQEWGTWCNFLAEGVASSGFAAHESSEVEMGG